MRRSGGRQLLPLWWIRAGVAAACLALLPARAQIAPDMLALESGISLRPRPTLLALEERLARVPATSPEALTLLALLAGAQMRVGQLPQVDAVLARLARVEQEAAQAAGGAAASAGGAAVAPMAVSARAVGQCLRAELELRRGSIQRAEQMLAEVLASHGLEAPGLLLVRLRCLGFQAGAKMQRRQFVESVRLYQEAIRLAQTLPAQRRSLLHSNLAYTLIQAGQWQLALDANTEAMALARQADDPVAISEALTIEAMLYSDAQHADPVRELRALEESLRQTRRAGSLMDETQTLGNLADYYLNRRDYPRALHFATQALELARRTHYRDLEDLARINMGLALLGMKRREEGLAILRDVNEAQRQAGNLTGLSEVLLEQAALLEQLGDPGGALKAYRAEQALAQDVALHEQQTQVLTLREQFDASERERSRRRLIEERQLQQELLRRQRLQVRLWGLSALLGLLLVPVLWLWYARTRAAQQALRHSTERLRRQSLTDPLTGLPNRRMGQERMPGRAPARGALYLIDLDHFKQINDRHGHAVGDEVLVEVAQRLRSVLREPDLVLRWGGEEFLVLVDEADIRGAHLLARRLLVTLADPPVRTQAGELRVTGSVGYVEFRPAVAGTQTAGASAEAQGGMSAGALAEGAVGGAAGVPPADPPPCWDQAFQLADALMYLAKTRGRNRACGLHGLPATGVADLASRSAALAQAWAQARVDIVETAGPQPQDGPTPSGEAA